jgi:ankyrin repeat protein
MMMSRTWITLVVALGVLLFMPDAIIGSKARSETTTASGKILHEFLAAAQSNDVVTLRRGQAQGLAVDTRDRNGRSALLIATYANAIDAARLLIQAGADVNAKDSLDDSPYLYAGAEGRLEILKMTVAAGADLKSVNRYGGTALTPAAHHGHVDVVRYLLTTDVDINQVNNLGWTALLEAVVLGDGGERYIEIVRALVTAGADKMIADRDGVTPLQHARSKGYEQIIAILK